jgi:hypothetical protein
VRDAREDAAEADRSDEEAGQDVRDVGAVRDPGEPVEAAGPDHGPDEDDGLGAGRIERA